MRAEVGLVSSEYETPRSGYISVVTFTFLNASMSMPNEQICTGFGFMSVNFAFSRLRNKFIALWAVLTFLSSFRCGVI